MWAAITCGIIGVACSPFLAAWVDRVTGDRRECHYTSLGDAGRSRAYFIAVAAIIGLMAIGARWGGFASLPAFCWMTMTGIALVVVDLCHHRLPHEMVGAMTAGGILLLSVAELQDNQPGRLLRAMTAALVVFSAVFVVGAASGWQIGGGDVTVCGGLALYLGWLGWRQVLLSLTLAALLAGIASLVLVLTRRAGWGDRFAYGPLIISSSLIVVLLP